MQIRFSGGVRQFNITTCSLLVAKRAFSAHSTSTARYLHSGVVVCTTSIVHTITMCYFTLLGTTVGLRTDERTDDRTKEGGQPSKVR